MSPTLQLNLKAKEKEIKTDSTQASKGSGPKASSALRTPEDIAKNDNFGLKETYRPVSTSHPPVSASGCVNVGVQLNLSELWILIYTVGSN